MTIDRHSDTWKAVDAWAREEESKATERLINGTGNADKARGRIEALRELQKLTAPAPKAIAKMDTYLT